MNILAILSANGFFLALILALLISILKRNGHSEKISKKVKSDIKKIKKQILDKE